MYWLIFVFFSFFCARVFIFCLPDFYARVRLEMIFQEVCPEKTKREYLLPTNESYQSLWSKRWWPWFNYVRFHVWWDS